MAENNIKKETEKNVGGLSIEDAVNAMIQASIDRGDTKPGTTIERWFVDDTFMHGGQEYPGTIYVLTTDETWGKLIITPPKMN